LEQALFVVIDMYEKLMHRLLSCLRRLSVVINMQFFVVESETASLNSACKELVETMW